MAVIEFPLVGGVDEETDDKVLPIPRLTKLENMRVVKPGSVECRPGIDQLGYGETNLDTPRRMVAFKDELLLLDQSRLYNYNSNQGFVEVEDSSAVTLDRVKPLAAYARKNVVAVASAATSSRIVTAWTTYDQSQYKLHIGVEEIGGSQLVSATQVPISGHAGQKCLHAAVSGTSIIVAWGDTSNRVRGMVIDSNTSGAWDSGDVVTLASSVDQTAIQFFDLVTFNGEALLAYMSQTANTVGLASFDNTGTASTSTTINTSLSSCLIGLAGDLGSNAHLHVVYLNGSSSEHKVYRLTTSLSTAASDSEGPGAVYNAVNGIAVSKYSSTQSAIVYSTASYAKLSISTGAATSYASENLYSCVPMSKPITHDGRVHFLARTWYDQANSYIAMVSVELVSGYFGYARPECVFERSLAPEDPLDNIAVDYANPYGGQSSTAAAYNSRVVFPVINVDRSSDPSLLGVATQGDQVVRVLRADLYEFNFNSNHQFMVAELGGRLYLGGGQVLQYDGQRLTEVGFPCYPDVQSDDITVSTTGGNVADGTYLYAFLAEWYDAAGDRHQSAPIIRTVTVTGGSGSASVAITVPGIQQTRKPWRLDGDDSRPVTMAVYRSEVNGETLHRLEGAGSTPFVELANSAINNGTFTDTYSDAEIALGTREILYTSSAGANELENTPPPPSRFIISHQDRLVGIMDNDPTRGWYSKSIRNGVGLASNDALRFRCEEPMVALGKQDGAVFIFSERSVFTMIGQGADNTGLGTSYEPPQRLSSEIGCIEPRSVVSTGVGIFFRSHRGIELMQRGGFSAVHTPQIQETLDACPIITAAVHDRESSTVFFACSDGEDVGDNSRVLVYDYEAKLWSIYDYGDGFVIRSMVVDNGASYLTPQNAGRLCWMSDGGVSDLHLVAREDSTFRDRLRNVTSFIDTQWETGDIRPGGPTGYGRVRCARLLGETLGGDTATVSVSYDSGNTFTQSASFTTTAESETQLQLSVARQKCNRIRFRVSEATSGTADSNGVRWHALSIEAKQIQGKNRLAAARRA